MKPFKTQAHIHSLNGAIDEITVLDMKEDGRQTIYIVDYRGVNAPRFLILSTAPITQTTCTGGLKNEQHSETCRRRQPKITASLQRRS